MNAEPRGRADPEERVVCQVRELAAGGDGVATLPDGRVLFVPFTAPGERVEARVVESRPRWARGRLLRVVEPGAARVEPRCPVFGRCGGCSWQHLAYPEQLRAKATILRDALERIGGIALDEAPVLTPSPRPWAYRSRARVLRRGGEVGFRARSAHDLCPVERCPVLAPELEAGLARLATSPADGAGEEEWELVLGRQGSLRCAPLHRAGAASEPVELSVLGAELRVSLGVFMQANGLLLEELVRAVVEATVADCRADARGLELHAGAGFFSVALARRFREWIAVESDRRAVADLRHNLARAGLAEVRVEHGRAGRLLSAWAAREAPGRFDRVLLDPPRGGLERGAARQLVALAPERIVYLSCDPATLARDARILVEGGYRLRALRGFDLFPQTPHVEALSVWERPAETAGSGPGPPADSSVGRLALGATGRGDQRRAQGARRDARADVRGGEPGTGNGGGRQRGPAWTAPGRAPTVAAEAGAGRQLSAALGAVGGQAHTTAQAEVGSLRIGGLADRTASGIGVAHRHLSSSGLLDARMGHARPSRCEVIHSSVSLLREPRGRARRAPGAAGVPYSTSRA